MGKAWLIGLISFGVLCSLSKVDASSQECLFGFYCDGMYDPLLKSKCENSSCVCTGDFAQNNCLPNVSDCAIKHGPTTQGHPGSTCTNVSGTDICSGDFETFHCTTDSNQFYEVHVLGSHQARSCCSDIPETSRIEVVNTGRLERKVVLVLASTQPVAWYLDMDEGVEIERVVLVYKTASLVTVVWSKGNVKEILKVSNVSANQNDLYGKGSGTIKLLQFVTKEYGSVTSFTGRFQVDQWRLHIGWPFKFDLSSRSTPSRYTSRKTILQHIRSSMTSSKHYILSSTPTMNTNIPEDTPGPPSLMNIKSLSSLHFSDSVKSSPMSSIINTYPPTSSVSIEHPQLVPSFLTLFHAFGTMEFHHISGLNYYANGTLKVRAPFTTQFLNSTSRTKSSTAPKRNSNSQIFRTKMSSFSPSPSFQHVSTTLVESSAQISSDISSSSTHTTSTNLLTLSSINTGLSLVPTAVTSSIPKLVSSAITPPISCVNNNSCHQQAICTDTLQGISCACKPGFVGNGYHCEVQTCAAQPCDENAKCLDIEQGVSCTCSDGFNGNGFECKDINECFLQPCRTNSVCENKAGSYVCICLEEGACRETRIVGPEPYIGRVEVLHNEEWGTICGIGWNKNSAQVACRDAGYPYLAGIRYDSGFGQIWLSNMNCNGSETKLANCQHPGWGNVHRQCTHFLDVGVECVPLTVRLADSNQPDEGRVEVYFDGEWGTICNNGWDIEDADVACREMGFNGAEKVLRSDEVQDGIGRIWLDNVGCAGLERFLLHCPHNGWGNTNCSHDQDSGIKCTPRDIQSTAQVQHPADFIGDNQCKPWFPYGRNCLSCDFELNTCSWRHEKQEDDFDWQRNRASTPTFLTGPPFDNTKKNALGAYMYIETTGRKPGDKAWLVSPILQPKHDDCLQFHFYMLGSDIGQLNVNIRDTATKNITRLWNLASMKDRWIEANVPLNFDQPSEIIFEAVSGNDHKADIAIDDIIVVQSNCSVYPIIAAPDNDECLTNRCHRNAVCVNTIGSFYCKCNKGYTGNGTLCIDLDECTSKPCHVNATCTNTIGGFSCECNPHTAGICDDAYRPCGLRQIFRETQSKIIGGNTAEKGSWPWIAAIFYSKEMQNIWCSGALINKEWILTAAHCFDQSRNEKEYSVTLGEYDILTTDFDEQQFQVKEIIIHPAYTPKDKVFDIAMVRLHAPANYTPNVLPICIPEDEIQAGTKCLIAGWGTRTPNIKDYPQFLQEAVVPIINSSTCQTYYSFIIDITFDMVCAGYTTGTIDACEGDSGGPLMCQKGDKWYLAGLTSFGLDCAAQGYPGVYTNVNALRFWVSSVLSFTYN